jgi:hypothetical protein
VQDPDFINWMRLAALPEFRKLHRVIDTALEAGTYNLTVTNNFDVVRQSAVTRRPWQPAGLANLRVAYRAISEARKAS